MPYSRSEPIRRWFGPRADVLGVLAGAHAAAGDVSGPGRPLDVSKPLAHAYVIGVVSEFQGFARDLHDLAVERLVHAASVSSRFIPVLTEGLTRGRGLDRGNADLRTMTSDFARLGLSPLNLAIHNGRWASRDKAEFSLVFRLRNALAHGNERELRRLRTEGVRDTVTWSRSRLPVLNRVASSLDRQVWDHLSRMIGANPWR